MKSFRTVSNFEHLEQKRLLAADSCEHEPAYAPDEAELVPFAVAHVEGASRSFRASAELQNKSTTNGDQAENDDNQTNETQASDNDAEDDNDDAADQDETEEQENSDDDEDMSDDDDMTGENTDENETDDQTDENQTSDDETDEDDTDDDDTDDDEMDDDEIDDEIDDDETNSTATRPATTVRIPLPKTTVEQLGFAASESGLSRQAVPVSEAIQAEEAPSVADATRVDLLLAVIENDARDEPVSTEFVGVSEPKDAAPTVMDLVFETLGEDVEPPGLPSLL